MGCGSSKAPDVHVHQIEVRRPSRRPSKVPRQEIKTDQNGVTQNKGLSVPNNGLAVLNPPPGPPKSKKEAIFRIQDYQQYDDHATKVTDEYLYQDFQELVRFLTAYCTTDLQKVRVLFRWLSSIDLKAMQYRDTLPEPNTPLDYLLRLRFNMGNHAHMFSILCRYAGIVNVIINGVTKSAAYQLGQPIDRKRMAGQWNAVLIDKQWRLIDVFWASTCVVGKASKDWALVDIDGNMVDDADAEDEEGETMHRINEFFFLTDPEKMINTHFPDDTRWQLLAKPMTKKQFEEQFYIRERFYELGVTLLKTSLTDCVLKTNEGEVNINFGLQKKSKTCQFRYLLYRSRSDGANTDYPFERFVFFQKKPDEISYRASFPVTGKFKMDLFGKDTKKHEDFDLLCSYLVDCPVAKVECEPLPDCPEIGWGPGAEVELAGLKPKTHNDALVDAKDGQVEIRFDMAEEKSVLHDLKHNYLEEWFLKKHAVTRVENGQLIVLLRLPQGGEFAYALFADEKDKLGEIGNVCNYLIKSDGGDSSTNVFPKLHNGLLGAGHLVESLGIKPVGNRQWFIKTNESDISLQFECGDDVELLCEVHSNDFGQSAMQDRVQHTTFEGGVSFDIKLPKAGEYGINLFARRKNDPSQLYHAFTYMVESSQSENEDISEDENSVDVHGTTVQPIEVLQDTAEVRVPRGNGKLVAELDRKGAQESADPDRVKSYPDGDDEVFQVKLPEHGEYRLEVYEENANGSLESKAEFYFYRRDPLPGEYSGDDNFADPSEQQRRREEKELEAKCNACRAELKAAMAANNIPMLEQAIETYKSADIPEKYDNGQLKKAERFLNYLHVTENLTAAMNSRSIVVLEAAIHAAEDGGFEKQLGLQLGMAKRLLDKLLKIERLRHEIMKMDARTIAEIKSYSSPPVAVHRVMAATLRLLGESESNLKDWPGVVILIGKTGKESLKRKVSEFVVEKLKIEIALATENMIKGLDTQDVRDVSAGAATFFVWTTTMIDECKSRFTQEGGDLSQVVVASSRKN